MPWVSYSAFSCYAWKKNPTVRSLERPEIREIQCIQCSWPARPGVKPRVPAQTAQTSGNPCEPLVSGLVTLSPLRQTGDWNLCCSDFVFSDFEWVVYLYSALMLDVAKFLTTYRGRLPFNAAGCYGSPDTRRQVHQSAQGRKTSLDRAESTKRLFWKDLFLLLFWSFFASMATGFFEDDFCCWVGDGLGCQQTDIDCLPYHPHLGSIGTLWTFCPTILHENAL